MSAFGGKADISLTFRLRARRHRNGDQHLQRLRGSRGVKQARARVDRAESDAPVGRASYSDGRARDRAHLGVTDAKRATRERSHCARAKRLIARRLRWARINETRL
jgi:hypothetical protein